MHCELASFAKSIFIKWLWLRPWNLLTQSFWVFYLLPKCWSWRTCPFEKRICFCTMYFDEWSLHHRCVSIHVYNGKRIAHTNPMANIAKWRERKRKNWPKMLLSCHQLFYACPCTRFLMHIDLTFIILHIHTMCLSWHLMFSTNFNTKRYWPTVQFFFVISFSTHHVFFLSPS